MSPLPEGRELSHESSTGFTLHFETEQDTFCMNFDEQIATEYLSLLFHIKTRQSREADNTGHTRRRKTNQKHNTICAGHRYTQTNTNS
jgi:hypothetical protein